jgi:AcrR family transcriptional regulator
MDATSLSLRERKKLARKERIEEAALKLFRKRGFEHTTVEEIAAAADVGKGTFFNYFPTKEAVLLAISDRQMARLQALLDDERANAQTDVRTRLLTLFDVLAHGIEAEENPELVRLTVFEVMKHPETLERDPNRMRLRDAVHALIEEGQTAKQIRADVEALLIAQAIEGVYFQQIFEWCAAPNAFELGPRLRKAITLLLEGVATHKVAH